MADFGLLFYNARWYDPALGRFAQADTIVPPGVQGWDRYAYANNSPMRYSDPSGHYACSDDYDFCGKLKFDGRITVSILRRALHRYGVILEDGSDRWTERRARGAYLAVYAVASSLAEIKGTSTVAAFRQAFRTNDETPLVLRKVITYEYQGLIYSGRGVTRNSHLIEFGEIEYVRLQSLANNVVHELGHSWDADYGWKLSEGLEEFTGGKATGYFMSFYACKGVTNAYPGCNAAGYYYGGTPPVGSDWLFNRREDFAESFAALALPNEAIRTIQEKFGQDPTLMDMFGYPDYIGTPRGMYMTSLIYLFTH